MLLLLLLLLPYTRMPNPTLLEDGAVDASFGLAAMMGGGLMGVAVAVVLGFKEAFPALGDMAASKASRGGNLDKGDSSFFCAGSNSST